MDKRRSWNLGYWLAALLLPMLVQGLWQSAQRIEVVPYSAFEQALAEGRIAQTTRARWVQSQPLSSANGGSGAPVSTRSALGAKPSTSCCRCREVPTH
jgi:cell division protease FtsH